MTIDERLERLVERHEALTLSVELHDQQIGELSATVRALTQATEKHDKQIGDLTPLVAEVAQGTARLLHAVQAHERRRDGHEGRIDRLKQ